MLARNATDKKLPLIDRRCRVVEVWKHRQEGIEWRLLGALEMIPGTRQESEKKKEKSAMVLVLLTDSWMQRGSSLRKRQSFLRAPSDAVLFTGLPRCGS